MKPLNVIITAAGLDVSGGYDVGKAVWCDTIFNSETNKITAVTRLPEGRVVCVPTTQITVDPGQM